MNVVLCGMPGSGKTTISQTLHALTGLPVFDTDEVIVSHHGVITQIFAEHGEAYFRDKETEAVAEVSAQNGAIIATGGGCVLRPRNVELLKQNGVIVYLCTQVSTLVDRLRADTSRPLLQGGVEDRLNALYTARHQIYESVADLTVVCDDKSCQEIAQEILKRVQL